MELSVQQVEAATNHWRECAPAHGNEGALSPEVNLLASVYALMIYRGAAKVDLDTLDAAARQLLHSWCTNHPSQGSNA